MMQFSQGSWRPPIGLEAGLADLRPVKALHGLVLEKDLEVPVDDRDGVADGV